jgi:hypothetical protein
MRPAIGIRSQRIHRIVNGVEARAIWSIAAPIASLDCFAVSPPAEVSGGQREYLGHQNSSRTWIVDFMYPHQAIYWTP